jgi:hypothetical protein
MARKRAPRDSSSAKREHPYETTFRELFDRLEGPDVSSCNERPLPAEVPDHIRRLLNHYAARKSAFAYGFLLFKWLTREGVTVPEGLLRHDPFGPGAGGKVSSEKYALGIAALGRHFDLICGDDTSPEVAAAALRLPASRHASEIARELLPEEYEKNRDAARKKVQEAMDLVRDQLRTTAKGLLPKYFFKDFVDMLLTGTFPLGSKLDEIHSALQQIASANRGNPKEPGEVALSCQ